jgi:hypothetical protein
LFDEQRDFIRQEFALGFDTLAPTTTIQPTRAETIQVALQTEKSVSAGIIPMSPSSGRRRSSFISVLSAEGEIDVFRSLKRLAIQRQNTIALDQEIIQ